MWIPSPSQRALSLAKNFLGNAHVCTSSPINFSYNCLHQLFLSSLQTSKSKLYICLPQVVNTKKQQATIAISPHSIYHTLVLQILLTPLESFFPLVRSRLSCTLPHHLLPKSSIKGAYMTPLFCFNLVVQDIRHWRDKTITEIFGGSASDWSKVVTRQPYQKVWLNHLRFKESIIPNL